MKKLFLSFLFIFVLFIGAFFAFEGFHFFFPKGDEKIKIVDVAQGESLRVVAKKLFSQGVITNEDYFVYLAKLTGKARSVRVGEYEFKGNWSPFKVLNILASGRSVEYSMTIPEGTNMYEIATMFEIAGMGDRNQVIRIFKDKKFIKTLLGEELYSLEGYLFPETYKYTKFTKPKKLIAKMVKTFLENYKDVQVFERRIRMSRHEIVTLASIVEKETGVPEERNRISSVFHNRIRKNMRLQTDPTVLYGILDITKTMKKNITKKDLRTKTAYNTYRINGLPKGPISNPGKEALLATVQPESSSFLYFVSRNDGTHVFSETYKKHNAAVRKFQLDPSMRRGKSWRDYKKN